jgi:hypothetical protein
MASEQPYEEAAARIEEARKSGAKELYLSGMGLTEIPESVGSLIDLESLDVGHNKLTTLPETIGKLKRLKYLRGYESGIAFLPEAIGQCINLRVLMLMATDGGRMSKLPESIANLRELVELDLDSHQFESLPSSLGKLSKLEVLDIAFNHLKNLPTELGFLPRLKSLRATANPFEPELEAALADGVQALQAYLRAKATAQVVLNEAKLIVVGEGEVGKSCLLAALRGDVWVEGRSTTHGIEIKSVQVCDPDSGREITLNGWDFGGQRVYRPTHQLFFSAPAVYLVAWKPREGSQQGLVKEWITLIKLREPDAQIIVVATHGGPEQRQPDLDRQEIWDLFGRETVRDFALVDSKPDANGQCPGVAELKDKIARLAAMLPEMGRAVPGRWQQARGALQRSGDAYLMLPRVLEICGELGMDEQEAKAFLSVSHRLGHIIHWEHDPALRDIVVLKPDWLATAISFVLDDKQTRDNRGLVTFERLGQLWNDPARAPEFRYEPALHPLFLRLMERYDLSYRVSLPDETRTDESFWLKIGNAIRIRNRPVVERETLYTSLIGQLVPDVRPDPIPGWTATVNAPDEESVQICRIVEASTGLPGNAEGLFYQLIVRMHPFSLGRQHFEQSVHWQRGLLLDDDYNGRALLEQIGTDVRITVRAAYPERLLSVLTNEVKWLVERNWPGLRCDVMVPCIAPCGRETPGIGLFDVQKLIESKKDKRPEYPCPVCNKWQDIDGLLRNAPAARAAPADDLVDTVVSMKVEMQAEMAKEFGGVRALISRQHGESIGRFDNLDASTLRVLSRVDDTFTTLMQALTDEAREGPRLFSFQPIEPGFFDRPKWISQKFRLTLWCEHSRLPLPSLNSKGDKRGVYELTFPREWFVKAAPFLRVMTGTLGLVLPVASSATKLVLDDAVYKSIEEELDLGEKSLDAVLDGTDKADGWLSKHDAPDMGRGDSIGGRGAVLRQLHAFLREKDPSFGGLVRVKNKRHEFLWVHPKFEKEY